MTPVGGEIFSALAQKTHGLSQLHCHEDPGRHCSAATACAEGSKSHKTVLLLLLAREIKKCHLGLSVNPVRGFSSCPWSPSQFSHLIPKGQPLCPDEQWSQEVSDGEGPSALAGVWSMDEWLCAPVPSYKFLE